MADHSDLYQTKNLCLASTLECVGIPLRDILVKEEKATFVFDNTETLQVALKVFKRKEHRVEPDKFFNTIRSLKSRMYESLNE